MQLTRSIFRICPNRDFSAVYRRLMRNHAIRDIYLPSLWGIKDIRQICHGYHMSQVIKRDGMDANEGWRAREIADKIMREERRVRA